MKFIKYLFFALLGIFGVYLLICLFGDKTMKASESITMKGTPIMAYEEVVSYKNWTWSPWKFHDTTIIETLSGPDAGIGARSSWTSENSGSGFQEIIEAEPGKRLKMKMNYGMETNYSAQFFFEAVGDSTKVTWTFDEAETPFIGRGYMTIANMQKTTSNMFKEGLKMLKDKVESKKPSAPSVEIEMVDIPETWYVGKKFMQVHTDQIDSSMYAGAFGELMGLIGGPQNMTGAPMSIAHNYSEQTHTMDLEIALPIAAKMEVPAGFNCASIPAGKCAKYVHVGSYDATPEAWGKFMGALMASGTAKPRWSGYEIYVNDPGTVKDPAQYITWLMQPVE
jgi:effector-binding domain-containing protein